MSAALVMVTAAKAIVELALLCLLGQGLLYLLAGQKRDTNLFYQTLKLLASPPMKLARLITPVQFPPLWIGCIAFSMLASAWVVATYYKICMTVGAC